MDWFFFASIVSSIVSMAVLYITTMETRKLTEEARKKSIKPVLDIWCPNIIFLHYKMNQGKNDIQFNYIKLGMNVEYEAINADLFEKKLLKIVNLSNDNASKDIKMTFKENEDNRKFENGINSFQYRYLRGSSELNYNLNYYLNPHISEITPKLKERIVKYINDKDGKKILNKPDLGYIQKDDNVTLFNFTIELEYSDIEGYKSYSTYEIRVNAVSINYINKDVTIEIDVDKIKS